MATIDGSLGHIGYNFGALSGTMATIVQVAKEIEYLGQNYSSNEYRCSLIFSIN
jgi:hypothetical protein